jgi:hypothetical protein
MYSPNITADTETGIGSWSDADFLKAVHEGVGKGGLRLYPAFPYAAYTYLTDDDVLSINPICSACRWSKTPRRRTRSTSLSINAG